MGLPMPVHSRFAEGTKWVGNDKGPTQYRGQLLTIVGKVTEEMTVRVALATSPSWEFDADLAWLD